MKDGIWCRGMGHSWMKTETRRNASRMYNKPIVYGVIAIILTATFPKYRNAGHPFVKKVKNWTTLEWGVTPRASSNFRNLIFHLFTFSTLD